MLMRRSVLFVAAVAVSLVALRRSPIAAAQPAGNITIHVSAAQGNAPVEFAVRYMGAGFEHGDAKDLLKTPYDITVPGDEVYAVLRQTGGTGVMRVEARKGSSLYGSQAGPVTMVIIDRGKLAVTGFQR